MANNETYTLGRAVYDLMLVRDILHTDADFSTQDATAVFKRSALERVCIVLAHLDHFVIQWRAQSHRIPPKLGMNELDAHGEALEQCLIAHGGVNIAVPTKLVLDVILWTGRALNILQVTYPSAAVEASSLYLDAKLDIMETALWQDVFDLKALPLPEEVAEGYTECRTELGSPGLFVLLNPEGRWEPLKDQRQTSRRAILLHLAGKFGKVEKIDI